MEVIDSKVNKLFLFFTGCFGIAGFFLADKIGKNIFETCFCAAVYIMMMFVGFLGAINNKLWIYEDRIEIVIWNGKKIILKKENLKAVVIERSKGKYCLYTKDNRMYQLYYPFCKKKILKMCSQIKEQYPDFEIIDSSRF